VAFSKRIASSPSLNEGDKFKSCIFINVVVKILPPTKYHPEEDRPNQVRLFF
jgi:hypothetical protein